MNFLYKLSFIHCLEVVKALHLLKELLIEAESRQDISDDSSVIEPLVETSDILGSNLFTRLVNIQNTLGKVSIIYVPVQYNHT